MGQTQAINENKIVQNDNITAFKSPQQKKQSRILLIVILLIGILGAAAYFFILPKDAAYVLKNYDTAKVLKGEFIQSIQASGSVAIPVQLNILSPAQAYAETLHVEEGDSVQKGQLLAQMDAPDLAEELEDLQTSLEDSRLNLNKVEVQNQFNLDKLNREIEAYKDDIDEAEEDVEKFKKLVDINASRESELEAAEKTLKDLMEKQAESRISLSEEIKLQKLDKDIREAEINQLTTKIERLQENIKELLVTSPMEGEVLSLESSLSVPGSYIAGNSKLFTISNPDSAIVELEVLEDYAGVLKEGQKILLTISSVDIYGTITNIGKVAEMSSDGLGATVLVKVKPETTDTLLLGSTAVGTIEIDKKDNALYLPRGPYLTTGSQRYVYKIDGQKAVKTEVSFGEMESNRVEVLKGLEQDDLIITSGYQNFIENQEIILAKGE